MPPVPVDPRLFIGKQMTLRPTVIGGRTAPNDYIAVCEGWHVGRIMFEDRGRDPWWGISLTGPRMPQPEFVPGVHLATLAEAKAELRRQFDAWLVRAIAAGERGEAVEWYGPR